MNPNQLDRIGKRLEQASDINTQVGHLRVQELRNIRCILYTIEDCPTTEAKEIINEVRIRLIAMAKDPDEMGKHAEFLGVNI